MLNNEILITVAFVLEEDPSSVQNWFEDLYKTIQHSYQHFEILIINNKSNVDLNILSNIFVSNHKNIRLISLTNQHEHEIATVAAIENSIGDYVVIINPNMDPPNMVLQIIEECEEKYDIVIARRNDTCKEPFYYRIAARIFYSFFSFLTGVQFDQNWSGFVCMSRHLVNSITEVKDRVRFLKLLYVTAGYREKIIDYTPECRRSITWARLFSRTKSLFKIFFISNDSIIWGTALFSFIISAASLCYTIYALLYWLFVKTVTPGWTSTSIFISLMLSILFLVLGVMSMQINLIYQESKKGPLYYMTNEISSSEILVDMNKKNVVEE